jgi:Holliday junction resolvase RusA-like endonuclease
VKDPKALKHVIEGVMGKARPRVTRSGHAYTPKNTVNYENYVKLKYVADGGERREGPIKAVIHVFYEIPQSATKKRRTAILEGLELPTKKPDADNIAKIILDSLNGIAFHDDSQVTSLEIESITQKELSVLSFSSLAICEVKNESFETSFVFKKMPLLQGCGIA